MSQIATTIEQSKRLLAAGLDPESADMCYKTLDVEDSESDDELVFDFITRPYSEYLKYAGPLCLSYRAIPAWSLSRLWDICNDSGIGPFNFGGNSIESSEIVAKLVEWIILGVHDYEVLDEYLNEETRQEQSHADH